MVILLFTVGKKYFKKQKKHKSNNLMLPQFNNTDNEIEIIKETDGKNVFNYKNNNLNSEYDEEINLNNTNLNG